MEKKFLELQDSHGPVMQKDIERQGQRRWSKKSFSRMKIRNFNKSGTMWSDIPPGGRAGSGRGGHPDYKDNNNLIEILNHVIEHND